MTTNISPQCEANQMSNVFFLLNCPSFAKVYLAKFCDYFQIVNVSPKAFGILFDLAKVSLANTFPNRVGRKFKGPKKNNPT